jgi:tRNA 5-methylaminomethyl-2-thiouridine biosynthesis bifunctional protein
LASGFVPLIPAVGIPSDGTLYSQTYDDVYASDQGTLEQARHVFIRGNDLTARWAAADRFTIVETGFGTGLNFLASWVAWRAVAGGAARLDYVSVEKHPFPAADLAAVLARYPALAGFAEALQRRYPLVLPGFHRLHLDRGRISLTLLFGDAVEMLGKLEARADAFYLDGFAPAKNPQM